MSVRMESNAVRELGRAIGNGTGYTFPAPFGSITLVGLTDVAITSPQNGDVLTYNSSSGKWANSPIDMRPTLMLMGA